MKVELLNSLKRAVVYACAAALGMAASLLGQGLATTTVQGTLYLANGSPAAGTVQISWPAFTTASGQAVAAGRTVTTVGRDGFLSVSLTPNQGATPAGLYYTVVYNLSDGSTSTEYWTVPAAGQAALSAVRAQVMPSAQAVQAVNKAYVDNAVSQIAKSQVTSGGGTMTGPLFLNGDPQVPLQAANKHYVDYQFAQAMPKQGGNVGGPLSATRLGGLYQVDQISASDFGAQLQACVNLLAGTNGGTCDARNFTGTLAMGANVTLGTANLTIDLPCATIATSASIVVPPGTRNVTLHGCASRGTSAGSGSQGGTVFLYSGSGMLFAIGDPAYVVDTLGFHLDNVVVNTTASTAATAQALTAYRTQEMSLQSMYLLGNANQTGMTLDGTGNYTGGSFTDVELNGFQTALNAVGHRIGNPAPTDWLNASTFVRLHIDCPTANGSPVAGTIGINLQQGDGNTFTGGDVEGCGTALHLGPNAQNNTIVGLRTENSLSQVVADAGSSYNNWITGGTMFTGQLTDNGTRNSFLDTFHRSFNGLNGDWFGSQQDATLTNHYRLGVGTGNERGLLTRYQTDAGYRWTTGLSDASAGAQFYQVLDELNNVYRLSIGQYNTGQSSTNNQTVINAAGTGAIVLNGSNRAGTGGVVFGSGGTTSTTVGTVDKAGNAQFNGALQVGGSTQSTGTLTVRNNADAEVDYYLWPGLTANQKGSFTYKDYAGNSQWYLVKDASNNWALNSAVGGLDSIKAYQSNNSGDTYINASNAAGAVRVNYESGAGAAFHIYGGSSSNLYASFLGPSAIKFPGLAATSGHNCVQIDNSGYLSNTGAACASGMNGTVNSGNAGQIAYYNANGVALAGLNAVPLTSGGTGASDGPTALANLGALPLAGGALSGALTATQFNGPLNGTATHAQNLPADFAAQSAVSPQSASFTTVGVGSSLTMGGSGEFFAALAGKLATCAAAGCVIDASGFTPVGTAAGDLTITQSNVTIYAPYGVVNQGNYRLVIAPGVTNVAIKCKGAWSATNSQSALGGCGFSYDGSDYAWKVVGAKDTTTWTRYISIENIGIFATASTGLNAVNGLVYLGPQIEHVDMVRPKLTCTNGVCHYGVYAEANGPGSWSAFLVLEHPEIAGPTVGVRMSTSYQPGTYTLGWGQSQIIGGRIMASGMQYCQTSSGCAGTLWSSLGIAPGATVAIPSNASKAVQIDAGEISSFGTDLENADIGLYVLAGNTYHMYAHPDGCCVNAGAIFDSANATGNFVIASNGGSGNYEINGAKWNTQLGTSSSFYNDIPMGGNAVWQGYRDTELDFRMSSGKSAMQYACLWLDDNSSGSMVDKWSLCKDTANGFRISDKANAKDRYIAAAGGSTTINTVGSGNEVHDYGDGMSGAYYYYWGGTNGVMLAKPAGGFTAMRTFTFPDASANPIQPLGSATAGQFVQYVDAQGVQHLAAPPSATVHHLELEDFLSGNALTGGDGFAGQHYIDSPMTITYATGYSQSWPVSCATYPGIKLQGSTQGLIGSTISYSPTNGIADSGTVSWTVNGGQMLKVMIAAPAGCTSVGANFHVALTYQ